MDFTTAIRTCLKEKYATFSGRARRSEYWFFTLFIVLVGLVAGQLDAWIFGGGYEDPSWLGGITGLALLLPQLSVSIRRLHDIGRSGWWILLGFIPLIGQIVLIVWYCQDSKPGTNAYGADPKGRSVVIPASPAPQADLQAQAGLQAPLDPPAQAAVTPPPVPPVTPAVPRPPEAP